MNKLIFVLLSTIYFTLNINVGFAQKNTGIDLSTPYKTVETHLANLPPNANFPKKAAKTFRQDHRSEKEAIELASKLKKILDGQGLFINMETIPDSSNYLNPVSGKHKFILIDQFPEIYLEKVGDQWFYSEETAQAIPKMFQKTYPFGTHYLLSVIPKGEEIFLGIKLWQYVGLILLIIATWVVHKILTLIFRKVIVSILNRTSNRDITDNYIRPVARPISFFVITLFLIAFVPSLQLPIVFNKYLMLSLRALLPFFAMLVIYYLVNIISLYFEKITAKTASTLDDQLVPLVRKVLKGLVVLIGFIFILQAFSVNITALIAGVSIGGIAFALAAQDTIKNFFGSIMIFVDRPFQIGDWITTDGVDGTVEEVGFRSTRVRTFTNSVVSVPNGKLADLTVDNHGLRVFRRFSTKIAITYDTPPALIEIFVEGLRKIVIEHPRTRKNLFEVHLNEMADSSLNIMFYVFFSVKDWSEELQSKHEVLIKIIRLAENLNVRFAFPTQTLQVETFPEKTPLLPDYNENIQVLREKMNKFFDTAQ